MFRDPKINVPVIGIVDNMAWFTPELHPRGALLPFGHDEAVDVRSPRNTKCRVLARIPLVASVGASTPTAAVRL